MLRSKINTHGHTCVTFVAIQTACLTILGKGSGKAILLAVGGAQESLHAQPGTYDLVSGKRVDVMQKHEAYMSQPESCMQCFESDGESAHCQPPADAMPCSCTAYAGAEQAEGVCEDSSSDRCTVGACSGLWRE